MDALQAGGAGTGDDSAEPITSTSLMLVLELMRDTGISPDVNTTEDLLRLCISRETLTDTARWQKAESWIPRLKQHFSSDKLTCLHANANAKQKTPLVNMLRQLLRCHGFHLKSIATSAGYDKATGRKFYHRTYVVEPEL